MTCHALIVAAGSGRRFGGDVPKQYLELGNLPVLRRTALAFLRHPAIVAVRIVIDPDHEGHYRTSMAGLELEPPVLGGATRHESVRRGLEALAAGSPPDLVLVHDAARPLIDHATIDRVLAALRDGPAAVAGLEVTDALRQVRQGRMVGEVPRDGVWRAQTPQGFRFPEFLAAHRAVAADGAGEGTLDDAAVAAAAGLIVRFVQGQEANMKITGPDDLARAERLLALRQETRTGLGFDVHRLGVGDGLTLLGVRIPGAETLIGHSDADVGLHAVTDALLGAIGAGDIGQHFPPSDPRWRGADSAVFVTHALHLLRQRGGAVVHCDVTLICERPRIAPHREAMVARLAGLLGIESSRVSVKATTTEGLGFTGRGEGIAAQAVVTVRA